VQWPVVLSKKHLRLSAAIIGVWYELQERDSFFDYPHVFTSQEEELMSVIRDVGRRGAFIMQKDLNNFETNLAV
jgi:hypothetical protein